MHYYRMAVGIHIFVQLHDMSEWWAREILTIPTIFNNNPKTEMLKWRGPGGKPTSPVCPALFFGWLETLRNPETGAVGWRCKKRNLLMKIAQVF